MTPATPAGSLPLLEIRKYQNRRYYDTTHSRHLSLEEIHKLILKGHNIRAIDAKTGGDITSKVLGQILLEYEPLKLDLFSNELLTRVIRVNDAILQDFVDLYFRQAFAAFCDSQKQFEQMLRQTHQLSNVFPNPANLAGGLFQPWMQYNPMTSRPAAAGREMPASDEQTRELKAHLADLQEQLAELKAGMVEKKKAPRPARRK